MLIIVADDNRTQRDQLIAALRMIDSIETMEFADGVEALAAIREYRPDMAILDIVMRGFTGIEVVRALRDEGDQTPVILATSMYQNAMKDPNLKINGYIIKPFMSDMILEKVFEVLDGVDS